MVQPTKGLQLRMTLARSDVSSQPDLSSFRDYYNAAVARGDESPALLADAKLLLDTLDVQARAVGARGALWSASWVSDYTFPSNTWKPLRGVRLGLNGSWRDEYLFGTPRGVSLLGGASHLVNAYLTRKQKLWNRPVRVRIGVRNLTDLENGDLRTTSFTTLVSGANAYRYSYVMPRQYEFEVGVKF